MSPRLRIASISVASATALSVLISVAPPAFAEPCTGAAAAVQPPNAAPTPELPGLNRRPEGQRPTGANDDAPLPELGQLGDYLNSQSSRNAQVQQQAAVAPQPTPPDAATQPNAQPLPVPAAAPPAPPAPPGTSIVGWVTGPDSPNDTIKKFAITGTDLGIMWDNGDPGNRQVLMAFGDTYGYCGVRGQQWRYNTLFRTRDGALAKTIEVPNGAVSDQYSGSPLWAPGLSKQIINSIKFAPSEKGIIPSAGIAAGGNQYVNFMSIKNWDSDGRWTTNFSAIAVSPDNGEHWGVYPDSVRPASPDSVDRVSYVAGNENFQQGAFLKPGPGDPYIYSFGTPPGPRRFGVCVARSARRGARPAQVRILEFGRQRLGPGQSGCGHRRDPRPGQRDVGSVQHVSEAVPGALRQRRQRRRGADGAGPARSVGPGDAARQVVGHSRRHLRAVPASVVDG